MIIKRIFGYICVYCKDKGVCTICGAGMRARNTNEESK